MDFKKEKKYGLVIGNSTISASVTPAGRMYGRIVYNPPCFHESGNRLREAGECGYEYAVDGKVIRDCELKWSVTEKDYPRYIADAPLTDDIKASVYAFSPIGVSDVEAMFTPCAVTEYTLSNSSCEDKTVSITLEWHTTEDALRSSYNKKGELKQISDGQYIIEQGAAFLSAYGCHSAAGTPAEDGKFSLSAEIKIPAGGSAQAVFLLGIFDDTHRFKLRFDTASDVCRYVRDYRGELKAGLEDFISVIPSVGDDKVYLYTRWYMQAAVLLTKSSVTGEVITMGYVELNQRDSFWSSFVHVSLWSSLEREMIRLSGRWMRPDGKLPTTILPRIERDYDIDINEYFCLRIARYFRYHRDMSFLEEMYDAYLRSVEFLLSFDRDGDGIPEQDVPENPLCFWADWKDVPGIIGRKLAPHFCLLWLAVLKEGAYLAEVMGDAETKTKYEKLYETAYGKINLDTEDGGLWMKDHYAEVWYDGREMTEVLQDQTVGLIWGVVPEERIPLIYEALTRGENEYGIRETYPYRVDPDLELNEGGDYHNGGIWPYLMFCDITGRYLNGCAEDAERLIGKIGHYDLEVPGDFAPNEFLNGNTGENCGKEIQGWSSALYGALTHGAFRIEHMSEREIKITVNFKNRDFETYLILPKSYGRVKVTRRGGVLTCSEAARAGYKVTVEERA